MSRTNVKSDRSHVYAEERTAGGFGPHAAKQDAEAQLRRVTMACLLWEDIAYASGQTVADEIAKLIPQVDPIVCGQIAIECRYEQKLRHVPLLIAREMCRYPEHKKFVAEVLEKICKRADEPAEFLSLYWKTNGGKKSIPAQVKKGLARAFLRYDAYQLAKWRRQDAEVKTRDVMFLCHPRPLGPSQDQSLRKDRELLYKQLAENTLPTPDTWEVGLSKCKTDNEKRDVWDRLVADNMLGATALLKNLRNMEQVRVAPSVIAHALQNCKTDFLLPLDFLKARAHAPTWTRQLEDLMYRCAAQWPKISGYTVFVVDVSGSMGSPLSERSEFSRMDAAIAMTILAAEMCERVAIYATAGNDPMRQHKTVKCEPIRGFALGDLIKAQHQRLGGGGIFTRQVCDVIRKTEIEQPDRIVIFSDSCDCDLPGSGKPNPSGKRNYIIDVSSHTHGINYDGVWTAEIAGWSNQFLAYIAAVERQLN